MSGRIFQNVVLQLKENTNRTVGVIDGEGVVIACSELSMIGQRWAEHVPVINGAAGVMISSDGKTFKALNGWGTQFDYAAFAFGDNEISKTVCSMATVALNAAKSYSPPFFIARAYLLFISSIITLSRIFLTLFPGSKL